MRSDQPSFTRVHAHHGCDGDSGAVAAKTLDSITKPVSSSRSVAMKGLTIDVQRRPGEAAIIQSPYKLDNHSIPFPNGIKGEENFSATVRQNGDDGRYGEGSTGTGDIRNSDS